MLLYSVKLVENGRLEGESKGVQLLFRQWVALLKSPLIIRVYTGSILS